MLSILLLLGLATDRADAASPSSDGVKQDAVEQATSPSFEFRFDTEEQRTLWALALRNLRDGSPRAALPYLARLVRELPGNARLRLELAYALLLIGDEDGARHHFGRALEGEVDPDARAAATRLLAEIDQRKTWSSYLHFAVVPRTKPFRRTNGDTIRIGVYEFRLDEDSRAYPGTGLQLGGGVTWTPSIDRNWNARLSLAVLSTSYRQSTFNEAVVRAEAGLFRTQGRGGRIGGGLLLEHRRLGNESLYFSPGAYLSYGERLTPTTRLDVRGEYKRLLHSSSLRNVDSTAATLRLNHALTPRLAVQGAFLIRRIEAERAFNSLTEYELTVGSNYSFDSGLSAAIELAGGSSDHDAESPLFGEIRSDSRWRASVRLRNRNLAIKTFSPVFDLSYEQQRSNLALYDYGGARASFSFSRDF